MTFVEKLPPRQLLAGIAILFAAPFLTVALFKAQLYRILDVSSYLVFHNVAEFFSIMVSLSIFGLGWYAFDQNRNRHSLYLSVAFLAIGLMDFMHTLGYTGMPPLITPNTPNKSTQFWIAVRMFSAATFLSSAFIYPDRAPRLLTKANLMAAALLIAAVVFTGITFFPEHLPTTFIAGVGLTPFKMAAEYFIIALLLLALLAYWKRLSGTGDRLLVYYLAAFILCIYSELAFSDYTSVFDNYNVLGHIYKVIAFMLIYTGIFITSVRKPYQELRQSRNMLAHIMDSVPLAIFWKDRESRYLGCNRVFAQQAGFDDPEEIIGRSDFDLPWGEEASAGYRADDREVMANAAPKRHIVETLRMADGTTIWIDTTKIPLTDNDGAIQGVLGVYEDITERRKAEKEREQYLTFFNSSEDLMTIADPRGCFKRINHACVKLLGYSAEELLAKRFIDFVHPDDQQATLAEMARQIECGYSLKFENRYICADGSTRFLSWHASYIAAEGITYATARDITELKQLEGQLRQSQKMEAIGQLAGGVAHDFNNILSVIMGYGYMLKGDTKLDVQQQDKLDQIIAAAEKAAQLTGGLLTLSRKQVLATKAVNLNDIVQNLQTFLLRVIGEDVQLKTMLTEADLPVSVDSGQIEQALINLATNARDAMPQGGLLTVETGIRQIDDSFTHAHGYGQPGSYAVITVTDSGCGMDAETRKKIFEPFFTTKEPGKGTGLGMAIVYGIVKQHNGFINLYSEPGKGTTFRIYLPLASSATITAEHQAAPAPPAGGSETILVAEDEPMVSQLVAGILTEYGYEVILASDGKEVVAQFIANRDKVKLTLMDMIMPKQSGMAAAEELRRLQPATKILFSSGYTADFIRNRGMDDEGVELIMKPFQPLELLRKVREMLDRQ